MFESPRPSARRPTRKHPAAVALVVCALWAGSHAAPALAEPNDADLRKAEALATEAKVFFRSRLFKEAAQQFMEAFALSQRPALVYNAARAYEEGGYHQKAVALFNHYARLPDVDQAGREAALKRRDKLQAVIDARTAANERAAQEEARKSKAAQEAAARERAAAEARKAAEARQAEEKRKREKAAAAAAAAAARQRAQPTFPVWRMSGAGAALVLGLGCYLNALSLANEMPSEEVKTNADRERYLELESDARLWRGLAVGAAVIGVGVAGWAAWDTWLAAPEPAPAARAALVPTWQGDRPGAALVMRF